MLGRQNERNFCYDRLALTSIFGLCFMWVYLIKSNCYSLIYSSLVIFPSHFFLDPIGLKINFRHCNFFHVPLGLIAHNKLTKAKVVHFVSEITWIEAIFACFVVKSGICGDKNLHAQKQVYNFCNFFGIFNGKNTLFSKSAP